MQYWLYNLQLPVYISQFWEKKFRIVSLYHVILREKKTELWVQSQNYQIV